MLPTRRDIFKGLLTLPLFWNVDSVSDSIIGIGDAQSHERPSGAKSAATQTAANLQMVFHFEGPFAYLVYDDHIDVITPSIDEHDYCYKVNDVEVLGFPGDYDPTLLLLPGTATVPSDISKSVILDKGKSEIKQPDLTNRYWKIKMKKPSDIVPEGDPFSPVKNVFIGKMGDYVNSTVKTIYPGYKFVYAIDASAPSATAFRATREATLKKGSKATNEFPITYCVRPRVSGFQHAVKAFDMLVAMLPNLDLHLDPTAKVFPTQNKRDTSEFESFDPKDQNKGAVLDGSLRLCNAPSVFVTGF